MTKAFNSDWYLWLRSHGMRKKDAMRKAKGDLKLAVSGAKDMRRRDAKALAHYHLQTKGSVILPDLSFKELIYIKEHCPDIYSAKEVLNTVNKYRQDRGYKRK